MHWRRWTWALIVWTALMIAWMAFSAAATATACPATGGSAGECATYAGIAVAVIVLVWFVVAVPLSIIRGATRRTIGHGETRWGDSNDPPPG
jgi:hypothetical protein